MIRRPYRPQADQPLQLNITSLMDILTIVLIFLVVSFSTEESEITPPDEIILPTSTAEQPVKLAVRVSISPTSVAVEQESVVSLVAGGVPASALDANGRIAPLLAALKEQRARLEAGAMPPRSGVEDEREIVFFEAVRGTPYGLIDSVLKTAAAAGFSKFRLAVVRRS